jgi:hypothetical protein
MFVSKCLTIAIFVMSLFVFPVTGNVFGQANLTNVGDVTCPATGSSIQVIPARSSRFSYLLNNINGGAVRIGFLDTGTAALTNTTGFVLQPGQAVADSAPNVVSRRVVCMATGAASNIISFAEAFK